MWHDDKFTWPFENGRAVCNRNPNLFTLCDSVIQWIHFYVTVLTSLSCTFLGAHQLLEGKESLLFFFLNWTHHYSQFKVHCHHWLFLYLFKWGNKYLWNHHPWHKTSIADPNLILPARSSAVASPSSHASSTAFSCYSESCIGHFFAFLLLVVLSHFKVCSGIVLLYSAFSCVGLLKADVSPFYVLGLTPSPLKSDCKDAATLSYAARSHLLCLPMTIPLSGCAIVHRLHMSDCRPLLLPMMLQWTLLYLSPGERGQGFLRVYV